MKNTEVTCLAGYEISPRVDGKFNFGEAQRLVEKMNTVAFCGYSDWRLPSKLDWEEITANKKEFQKAFGEPDETYWSSSIHRDKPDFAWYACFYYIHVDHYYLKSYDHHVRLVRNY